MVNKKIDENYIIEAFLLFLKWEDWKKLFKNVTAVFEINKKEKILKHVHISDTKQLNWNKVEELWIKTDFLKNKLNLDEINNNNKWIESFELKQSTLRWRKTINMNNPDNIARSIMINFWWKSLLLWTDKVIKLFTSNALLKWTVIQHLSVGDKNGVKDYFNHFCEKNPKLKIVGIEANWLTKWKSILAKWEYNFALTNKEWKKFQVPANFTIIFVKRWNRWMIDVLHSSKKYNKSILSKLNQ